MMIPICSLSLLPSHAQKRDDKINRIDGYKNEITELAQQLVRIKSYSSQEGPIIKFLEQKMIELGFDNVKIDAMGNLLGTMGEGPKSILFDSHVDTVEVPDEKEWEFPPFGGIVSGGRLHGRGSVDMKSSLAASIYAAVAAKHAGQLAGKKVMVSCTVNEEDCDGENLKYLFSSQGIRPEFVVICEPSGNNIALGHKGKAQVVLRTEGKSAHGSAPEKGVNAVYEMAEIIQRVEAKNFAGTPMKLEQVDLKPYTGLQKVDCTGMGGLMVNPKIFEKINKPYFIALSLDYGPDVSLCYKCKKAGIQAWVDTDVRCGHIIPDVKF